MLQQSSVPLVLFCPPQTYIPRCGAHPQRSSITGSSRRASRTHRGPSMSCFRTSSSDVISARRSSFSRLGLQTPLSLIDPARDILELMKGINQHHGRTLTSGPRSSAGPLYASA